MTTELLLRIVIDTPLEVLLLIIAWVLSFFVEYIIYLVMDFICRVVIYEIFKKIMTVLEGVYNMSKRLIIFVLSILMELFTSIIKVIKNPSRLFSTITKRRESREFFSQKNLNYFFNRAENKEEIIGDLLAEYARMKTELPNESLNFEKYEEMLEQIRREMLKQIFVIKMSLIKTKIENIFLAKKKKIDD